MHELELLQGALHDHDGLIEDYARQLRDEQNQRVLLQAELDRVEAARSLAERSLQHATETAKQRAEDEMIELATAENEIADLKSDRDRLSKQLTEITTGDGPVARLQHDVEARDAEIERLHETIATLEARIDEF